MFDQQFCPNQFKPRFFISECGRIHRYAVAQVQHGHKIKSLGAILNFEQFCDQNTSNLRESPRPEKPRKRRIIIDSGSEVYSLKWAVYVLRPWILQEKLPWLAFGISAKFCAVEARWPHGWRARLRSERFGFEPWPGTLCCVLGQDTLLSRCLSSPRCINGYRRI